MTENDGRSVAVSLRDVVTEMDLPNDAWTAYLNRRTGELVTVTDEDQRLVEPADAELRPLEVADQRERPVHLLLNVADELRSRSMIFMSPV